MNDTPYSNFFLQPSCPPQRQYEALRAVFADGCRQKEVAQRFGYSYAAFRQLVVQFRAAYDEGQPPPFSPDRVRVVRPDRATRRLPDRNVRPQPIAGPSA